MSDARGSKRSRERSPSEPRPSAAAQRVLTGKSTSRDDIAPAIRFLHAEAALKRQQYDAFAATWEASTSNINESLDGFKKKYNNHNEALKQAQANIKDLQSSDKQNSKQLDDLESMCDKAINRIEDVYVCEGCTKLQSRVEALEKAILPFFLRQRDDQSSSSHDMLSVVPTCAPSVPSRIQQFLLDDDRNDRVVVQKISLPAKYASSFVGGHFGPPPGRF